MITKIKNVIKEQRGIGLISILMAIAVIGLIGGAATTATVQFLKAPTHVQKKNVLVKSELKGLTADIYSHQAGTTGGGYVSGESIFNYAIIALTGNITAYGSPSVKSDPEKINGTYEGDIYAQENISINNNNVIYGDAIAGGTITTPNWATNAILGKQTSNTPKTFKALNIEDYKTMAENGMIDTTSFENQAKSGHTYNGDYTTPVTITLGHNGGLYSYIKGNLNIDGSDNVTLSGSLYVTGNIVMTGSAKIQGNGTIIADGYIDIGGSCQMKPTGSSPYIVSKNSYFTMGGSTIVSGIVYAKTNINVNGSNMVTIGSQHVTGNITVSGSSGIQLTGTVYVDGSINVTGSSGIRGPGNIVAENDITTTGSSQLSPDDIPLIISKNGTVTVTGSSTVSAVIYAPNADLSLGGSVTVYGSVIGKSVSLTGSSKVKYPAETLRSRSY